MASFGETQEKNRGYFLFGNRQKKKKPIRKGTPSITVKKKKSGISKARKHTPEVAVLVYEVSGGSKEVKR